MCHLYNVNPVSIDASWKNVSLQCRSFVCSMRVCACISVCVCATVCVCLPVCVLAYLRLCVCVLKFVRVLVCMSSRPTNLSPDAENYKRRTDLIVTLSRSFYTPACESACLCMCAYWCASTLLFFTHSLRSQQGQDGLPVMAGKINWQFLCLSGSGTVRLCVWVCVYV